MRLCAFPIFAIFFFRYDVIAICVFIVVQFVIKGKQRNWKDLLQFPLSIVFTRFMHMIDFWFGGMGRSLGEQLFRLVMGILCTGIGAAMSVEMNLMVPVKW